MTGVGVGGGNKGDGVRIRSLIVGVGGRSGDGDLSGSIGVGGYIKGADVVDDESAEPGGDSRMDDDNGLGVGG